MGHSYLLPKDTYKLGSICDFKVRKLFPTYCELIDEENGITTYLQGTTRLKLFKDQTVRCRIIAITEKHPKIELVDIRDFEQSEDRLSQEKLEEILKERGIGWNTKDFIQLILTDEKEKTYESQCHKWIRTLINKKIDITQIRRDCSDILELSPLLDMCSDNEREFYQARFTLLIEQLGYYIKAAELIEGDENGASEKPEQYVNGIFNKLQVSGYVYHPRKNFSILSCLFLRQPELMNRRMSELLDIMFQRDLGSWMKEPFKSALIKLLELYVRENDGKIDRTKDNAELISNNLNALSLQLLLLRDNKDNPIADYRLNAARLCTIASYVESIRPIKLVDQAYNYLFASEPYVIGYSLADVKNKLIPHFLVNVPIQGSIDTINSFSQNKARLLVSADGIHILSSGATYNSYSVFPKDLELWNGLQVYMSVKPETSLTAVKSNDLTPYQQVWEEIELNLFNASAKEMVVEKKKAVKTHRIDDSVHISIIRQDTKHRDKFYCQIEDEIGGTGFITMNDIVPYSIGTISLRHFMTSDGGRYVFEAHITDKVDGQFRFSMKKEIKEWLMDEENNFYSYNEDIICSMGSAPNANGYAPAITKEGISVSVRNAGDIKDLKKNDIVVCHLVGSGSGTFHIECDLMNVASYEFDLTSAFKRLMDAFSIDRITDEVTTQEEENEMLNSDKILDESYVKELIYLVDRMALLETDYVKSYNYLGFSRILSMLIGWESQAAYYKGRMDIIAMLHYFAVNERVDEAKLEELANVNAELFSNNIVLKERFSQLQTISFLGQPSHNDELYDIIKENPPLKQLASLVLAYNITKDSEMDKVANDIHNRIKQMLNLKGFESGLKSYGPEDENEEVEYKTSIIHYAKDSMSVTNPDKQMDEILKVINSFMNTSGGTLFIGVNDYGLGVGLEEDMKSEPFFGNRDKYIRSILDAVSLKWGNAIATTYIKSIAFDAENQDKDVLIVKVKPHPEGVPMNGCFHVRISGSKRKLTRPEYEEFKVTNRKLPVVETTAPSIPSWISDTDEGTGVTLAPALVTSKEDEIRTSRIRKNILTEYMDGDNYVEPIGFFKFMGGGKFKKLDTYDYDEENSLLTLTVLESEQKDFLILGYENGHIVKVPVGELLDYQNREYSRYNDSKLIFASIGKEDDAVLTISREDKTRPRVVMRMDSITNFEEDKLMSGGILPYNEGLMQKILAFDIIPAEHKNSFPSILDKAKSFLGYPSSPSSKEQTNMLHLWGITEI